jgi:hypothetical protein
VGYTRRAEINGDLWLDSGWTEDDPAHSVHDVCKKLLSLSDGLGKWGRDTFGSVRKEIKQLKADLEVIRSLPKRVGPSHAEIKTSERLVELFHREEIMCRQRSRIEWLSAGDKNTKLFIRRLV